MRVEPFSIDIDQDVLDDLRTRIQGTRWPHRSPGAAWEQGTDIDYLRDVLAYWADGFDWREQERRLNELDHFRAEIDGVRIHFVHERARGGDGLPLILIHGWPSAFVEYVPLVPLLTDPLSHGIDGPGFDVVVPSGQVCCGQPAFNSGHRSAARRVARTFVRAFSRETPIVAPSGSCATEP